MTLMHLLLTANLLLLSALLVGLVWLWRRAVVLQGDAERLTVTIGSRDLRAEALRAGVSSAPFYTIEILNPLEVAAQESKLGQVFGGLTPAIVRREVHRQAHGILRQQLAERGIKADVKLHG